MFMWLLLCIPATNGAVQNLGTKLQKVLGRTKDMTMFFLLREQLIEVYIRIEGTVS